MISAKYIKALHIERLDGVFPDPDLVLALKANLAVMNSADAQIEILEKAVQDRVKLRSQFKFLKTVPGIGSILALTIMLETGEIDRFASVGNYASYCRCVGSRKISNGKRKGSGNTKTATSIWPGRLWRAPTLRSALIRESKASIRKRNPRAIRSWRSKQWRTSSAGLAITLSKIRWRLMSPRRCLSKKLGWDG
jgi:transposase